MKKITMFLIIAILTVFTGVVCAAPADTVPFLQTNPDGTVTELYSYGDETYNFVGDKDGYLLEKNDKFVTKGRENRLDDLRNYDIHHRLKIVEAE